MDGKEASAFIRNRKEAGAGGEEDRQARQQHVIEAVTKKLWIQPLLWKSIQSIRGQNTLGVGRLHYFYPGDNEDTIQAYRENLNLNKILVNINCSFSGWCFL